MQALEFEEDPMDPGFHHHVGEGDRDLTIAVDPVSAA
jgi:hypothetical protein